MSLEQLPFDIGFMFYWDCYEMSLYHIYQHKSSKKMLTAYWLYTVSEHYILLHMVLGFHNWGDGGNFLFLTSQTTIIIMSPILYLALLLFALLRELVVVWCFQSVSFASIGNRVPKTCHLFYNMSLAASYSYRGKWRWLEVSCNRWLS